MYMAELVNFNISDILQQDNKKEEEQNNLNQNSLNQNSLEYTEDQQLQFECDFSLIQCFWGNNLHRITAIINAINKLSCSECKLTDWIFIEAQESESQAVFKWLSHIGIKYIFKKIPRQSKNIWLKMPLWNIGVQEAVTQKLCFLDADICFEENNWAKKVSEALDKHDVISLCKYCKYENSDRNFESIGFQLSNQYMQHDAPNYGHGGFTLGMTRKALNIFGKFDAVNYLDDQWFWMNIVGYTQKNKSRFLLPYEVDSELCNGYPFNVGFADNVCLHLNHGNEDSLAYQTLHDISFNHIKPLDDIKYDKSVPNKLPIWRNNIAGKVMKKVFTKFTQTGDVGYSDYFDALKRVSKKTTKSRPLVIVTLYKLDFCHKNAQRDVSAHKNMIDTYCKNKNFTYICFSNEDIQGIDTVPYNSKGMSKEQCILQILSKKHIYPKNANVAYIDIDASINEDFELFCCNDTKDCIKYFRKDDVCQLYDINGLRYFKA